MAELTRGLLEEQAGQALLGLLGLLMMAAVWYPLQNRPLPGALALGGPALAVLLHEWLPPTHALSSALPGIAGAIAGLLVAGTAFLPLYLTGASTASDVKLMAMVGAFLGPLEVTGVILLTLLVGSLLSVLCNARPRSELPAVPCTVAIALGTAAWILLGTTGQLPGL